jgi:hypothetical protein
MSWTDRVYGDVSIDDPGLLALIASRSFQRLGGVRQAGPSSLAFAFKTITRREHSLGVFLLLRRLGADRREQVAGLLHDISHTAFSHAVDFVHASDEQDHHERLKPELLHRPDLAGPIRALGFEPEDFHDDSVFPLLEQPLPRLCADRLDYFLRDGLVCGASTPESVMRTLNALVVHDGVIGFQDEATARDASARFARMNDEWWASPTEGYIYNEFADALREGFRLGVIHDADLLELDDDAVLDRMASARSPLITAKLDRIVHFRPEALAGYVPRVLPKHRRIDPPVRDGDRWRALSEIDGVSLAPSIG